MKALTFLEFYNLTAQEKRDYLNSLGLILANDYKTRHDCQDSEPFFLDIYNSRVIQPFKPELITELFEGWVYYDRGTIKHFTREKWHIQFWNDNEFMRIYNDDTQLKHGYDKLNMLYHFPDTLERFISNCQQAGIELQFKEVTK